MTRPPPSLANRLRGGWRFQMTFLRAIIYRVLIFGALGFASGVITALIMLRIQQGFQW